METLRRVAAHQPIHQVLHCGAPLAGTAATDYAKTLQDSIRARDRVGLIGWIVDLRGNSGGNMWPMLAGVGPVLGEGVAGVLQPGRGDGGLRDIV